MSAFYVGQRVRFAYPDFGSRIRGLNGVDVGFIVRKDQFVDWRVVVAGKINPNTGDSNFPAFSNELEPLTPPHQAGDWSAIDKLLPNLREVTA